MKFVVVANAGRKAFDVPEITDYDEALRHARKWAKAAKVRLTSVTLVKEETRKSHDWERISVVPEVDGGGKPYFAARCRTCGITGRIYIKRRNEVVISRKYRNRRRWEECHG